MPPPTMMAADTVIVVRCGNRAGIGPWQQKLEQHAVEIIGSVNYTKPSLSFGK